MGGQVWQDQNLQNYVHIDLKIDSNRQTFEENS